MNVTRQALPGATRTCPHCRAKILESASICPACRHHLRAESGAAKRARTSVSALTVEGTIRHPTAGEMCEYSVLVCVRDDRGAEITRQVVGVGAMRPEEVRSFTLEVQVYAGL
jgi:hypothetical protein